jgi:hypothetical protein
VEKDGVGPVDADANVEGIQEAMEFGRDQPRLGTRTGGGWANLTSLELAPKGRHRKDGNDKECAGSEQSMLPPWLKAASKKRAKAALQSIYAMN